MKLLEVPYFSHIVSVFRCIIFLFSRLHGGFLWLDHPYDINEGLPNEKEDPREAIKVFDLWEVEFYEKYGIHEVLNM